MSRIGKLPIIIPEKVEVKVEKDNTVTVKGPLGTLTQKVDSDITVTIDGKTINVSRPTDQKRHRAFHGLYRSLINNMIIGVNQGFSKTQELVGVGYRASNQGNNLELSLGFSHQIIFQIPAEIKLETKSERGSNPLIIMKSADKQLLGQIAAKIRSMRPPEPYKGKGIKFTGEVLRRKAGKSAGK